ncbi:MAG: flagellar basal body-associated protein FliL [Methylocystaceae bacterium]|nr:MAG: flagellar basal body-associated protein FliL [Methylocystaceae bacterium]
MSGPRTSSTAAGDQKSSSFGQFVAVLLVSTLIGVGGGGFLGMTLGVESPTAGAGAVEKPVEAGDRPSHLSEKAKKAHGAHGAGESAAKETTAAAKVKLEELPPIVTNLAEPETGWVRLQAAIVYDVQAVPQPEILVSEVMADIVAFLRTTTLASIEGSDGLRRLHEDLTERAVIRSEGHIREFIIQALVVQ